jgi:predicted nucleotidyltransferase
MMIGATSAWEAFATAPAKLSRSTVGAVGGEQELAEAAEAYRVALGDRLLAAYALGSLAHGGFSELVSDIDLGLIVRDPLEPGDDQTIQAVADLEKSKGSPLHERLSVFWGTPATLRGERDGGRFPALDRLDLIENGRLLHGSDDARLSLPRPSARELLVTGAEFALVYLAGMQRSAALPTEGLGSMRPAAEDTTDELSSPDLLLRRGIRRVTKLVLVPVRFLYTAATGRVGTNGAAVARYLEDDEAPSTRLVAAALEWRTAPPADEALALELLRDQLLPLYLHYIDDHIERLGSIGETALAALFREWRDRLAG